MKTPIMRLQLITTLLLITFTNLAFAQNEFISIWKTDNNGFSNNDQIKIDFGYISSDINIYWEDTSDPNINGTETASTSEYIINFPSAGVYKVEVTGVRHGIQFDYENDDPLKIQSIENWGNVKWQTFNFKGCQDLVINANDTPDFEEITDLNSCFEGCINLTGNFDNWSFNTSTNIELFFSGCTNFNEDLSSWDVSLVENTQSMFYDCVNFNSDISNWNVSNIHDMQSMFYNCKKFNQNLNNWNTQSVTNLDGTFESASLFNSPLDNWDVSNVTDISQIFNGTSFNQNINNWDVSNVVDMGGAFSNTSFNQPLSNWNTSKVKYMGGLFSNNSGFNQDITGWNTSNVEHLEFTFSGATNFNQDISSWNTSRVKSMNATFKNAQAFSYQLDNWIVDSVLNFQEMFYLATNFNGNISNWNVSQANNMKGMFGLAYAFNQDISNWNVKNVTNMEEMFGGARDFNQDISSWDISNVENVNFMFFEANNFDCNIGKWNYSETAIASMDNRFVHRSGLSIENYDNLLIKLSLTEVQNVEFLAENLSYCYAKANVEKLRLINNWNFGYHTYINGLTDTTTIDLVSDYTFCEEFTTIGVNSNYHPVFWVYDGSGNIQNDTLYSINDSSFYFPSEVERTGGESIQLIAYSKLSEDYCHFNSDTLVITVNDHATVNVGKDTSITSGSIQLEGIMSNSTSFVWSTSGNGAFDDANSLTPSYTPSQEDYDEGMVKLTLTTLDGSCENRSDDLLLNLNDCSISIETEMANNTVKFTVVNTNSKVISNYLWAFGDGSVGRSSVTEHTYEATGDYPVSVIALSADGHCEVSANTNVTIETVAEQTYSITGTILSNGSSIDYARVGIFYISPDNRYELIIEDTLRPEDNGVYEFNNLLDFEYFVIASPEFTSSEFANSRPTFFGDALVWNTASTIQPSVNNSNLNINLVQYEPPYFWSQPGIDQIKGNVTFTPEEAKKSGSRTIVDNPLPVQSAIILLKDLNGNLLAYTTTDEFGDFSLTDLDAGIYTLEIQYIGTDISISQEIVVDGDSRTIDNFAFNIDQSDVSREDDPSGLFGSQVSTSNHLYPNPTIGNLYLKDQSSGLINYSVYSVQGELILSGQSDDSINLESLNSGIYLIEVNGVTEKIIKQ